MPRKTATVKRASAVDDSFTVLDEITVSRRYAWALEVVLSRLAGYLDLDPNAYADIAYAFAQDLHARVRAYAPQITEEQLGRLIPEHDGAEPAPRPRRGVTDPAEVDEAAARAETRVAHLADGFDQGAER
jgi:hypothetical protein